MKDRIKEAIRNIEDCHKRQVQGIYIKTEKTALAALKTIQYFEELGDKHVRLIFQKELGEA